MALHMFFQQRFNLFRLLAGNQAAGNLGKGMAGNDRLASLSLVAASDAVDFQRRTGENAFRPGEARFRHHGFHARQLRQLFIAHAGHGGPHAALPRGDGFHAIVKTSHGHAAVLVMEGSDYFRQGRNGVGYRAAEHAGMKVRGRALHDNFRPGQAAQAIGKRRCVRSGHPGIGNHNHVAGQFVPVVLDELGKTSAAHFLLPFQQEDHVHRKVAAVLAEQFLHAQNMGEQLPLVIRGAAGVNLPVPHFRFKRVGLPQLNGVHGLHVVVAVNQHGWLAFLPRAAGHHNGMEARLVGRGFQPHAGQLVHQPVRAVAHVLGVLLLGGNAGESQQGCQLIQSVHGTIRPRLGLQINR